MTTIRPYMHLYWMVPFGVLLIGAAAYVDSWSSMWIAVLFLAMMVQMASRQRIEMDRQVLRLVGASGAEYSITMKIEDIVLLQFAGNEIVINDRAGTSIRMHTGWFTGRQRDAVIAHVKAHAGPDAGQSSR